MSTWPVDLPSPVAAGHSEDEQAAVIRTQMEVGPAKLRDRSTIYWSTIPGVTFILTPSQLDTLLEFYRANRASTFDWTHPRTGEPVSARFVSQPVPRSASGGVLYSVTMSIEVLP